MRPQGVATGAGALCGVARLARLPVLVVEDLWPRERRAPRAAVGGRAGGDGAGGV